jgi:hypothetical protein
MHARLIPSCLILICLISISACNSCRNKVQPPDNTVNLGQDVTNDQKPKDPIFIDFEKNWRKFISPLTELALPVVARKEGEPKEVGEPIIQSECVFSADAGGMVPQVTLTWNETSGSASEPAASRARQKRPQEPPAASSNVRFDLTVHFKGFERNFYTSSLPTEKNKRFNLPSNSALVGQPEAVMISGPALFPKLMDYRTEILQDRETRREVKKQTVVLRDLSPGLSYTIRLSTLGENRWNEQRVVVFLTPVCPKSF